MTSKMLFDGGGTTKPAPKAPTTSYNTQYFNPKPPTYQGPPNINAGGMAPKPPATTPPILGPVGGGGGGGGAMPGIGGTPTMTLEKFIQNHILRQQAENEAQRSLEDFDAETLRGKQETEADMAVREQDLDMQLADMGRDSAGDFASRGLERSGLMFQRQDRINEEGVRRRGDISDLLTQFIGDRGRGRRRPCC
jgi:hypothetical protein